MGNVENDRIMISNFQGDLPKLKRDLKNSKPDESEEKRLNKEIEKLEEVWRQSKGKTKSFEDKIKKIDQEIEKLRKKRVQKFQDEVDDVRERLEKATSDIARNKAQ